jgi:hypothetical protein
MRSWLRLVGLHNLLSKTDLEIADDQVLKEIDADFHALLNSATTDMTASSIIIQSGDSGVKAWKALQVYYASNDLQAIEKLKVKIEGCRPEKGENIEKWLIRLRQMESILCTTGHRKSDDEMIAIIKWNLPSKFNNFLQIMNTKKRKSRETFEEKLIVQAELLNTWDGKKDKHVPEIVLSAEGTTGNAPRRDKKKVKCFACGKLGHYKHECWHRDGKTKIDEQNI